MGLLAPDTTSTYESPESAWRAADEFAFEQGYALSKPVGYDGLDSTDAPSTPEWYFEDSCPFSMSIVNYGFRPDTKPIWRLSSSRQPHIHGPRDLLHFCKIRLSNFEQEHLDFIREECAQGSSDESILSLVKEHFTESMDRVSIRDIRSITEKVQELDDHLTETRAVHHTRHNERNRPNSKFFMLGSEDAMGRGFFQLVLINVTKHATQSWKLVEINGYTARGTTFPVAVAITTSEDDSFYQWLIERFSEVRDLGRRPTVIISNISPHVADGFKHALPETKIQLCMSPFSKDILIVVKELWKGAKGKGALMKQTDLAKEKGTVPPQENQGGG
uniref:MULE transposase domain-containing protein n=1 Tax=Bionectria ochroleuca TaxID=29856 RepID=A0A8H7NM32_BIOOC